jgi:hypothetical protein
MQFINTTKAINFHNNTSQAITLEAWSEAINGIASFKSTTVLPGEKLVVYSSVGEWNLSSAKEFNIGIFRADPSASGDYSWLENDLYKCVYSENIENDIIGLMTFSEN